MIDHCKNSKSAQETPSNSIKSNKIKADLIQTLKVNLEAQDQMLEDEKS
jgi:hypothetical protein